MSYEDAKAKFKALPLDEKLRIIQIFDDLASTPRLILGWRPCPDCGTPMRIDIFWGEWGNDDREEWSLPDGECYRCNVQVEFWHDGQIKEVTRYKQETQTA